MEKQKKNIRTKFRQCKGADKTIGHPEQGKRKIIKSYKSPGRK